MLHDPVPEGPMVPAAALTPTTAWAIPMAKVVAMEERRMRRM